ncbi:MAG: radical SAM protein, partial [Sulfurovaceae bacterium]
MSSYYAKLHKDWVLRGWLDMPMVAVNYKNGQTKILDKKQFYVLQSCDGKTNFKSLAFLPIHLEILKQLIRFNIVYKCKKEEEIEPLQHYRYSNTPFIKTVQWCVTGKCNLKCIHCFMESPSGKYGELSLKDMKKLIDQFEEANVINVILTGGEPFLRQDIIDIIIFLKEKRIRVEHIFTNGLLVTDKHLKSLKELEVNPCFQISFDGVGSHDYMRGTKGIENKVIKSISQIQKAGFHVIVSTSIDQKSIDCLDLTYELMK